MAFSNLSFEYSAGTGATVLSGSPEPWAIATGAQLSVAVGGTVELWTFTAGDGADAATLAAAVNAQASLVLAADDGGYLRLTSLAPGGDAELAVLGGTANAALIFDSNLHYGVTYFGAPWSWSTLVLHTGKSVRELFTDDVDPTRELFGIAWFPLSALAYDQIIFTDNDAPSFIERFRVYESGWANSLNHDLPAIVVDFTQNDPDVSTDTEQFQAYEVGWLLAESVGVYDDWTEAEPDEVSSDGEYADVTFSGGFETTELFTTVIPGDRWENLNASGTDTVYLDTEVYVVTDSNVPVEYVTDAEKVAFRSRFIANWINRASEFFKAEAVAVPGPTVRLYLYPIVPRSTITAANIKVNATPFTPSGVFGDQEVTAWQWEDYFPPTTTFALP